MLSIAEKIFIAKCRQCRFTPNHTQSIPDELVRGQTYDLFIESADYMKVLITSPNYYYNEKLLTVRDIDNRDVEFVREPILGHGNIITEILEDMCNSINCLEDRD